MLPLGNVLFWKNQPTAQRQPETTIFTGGRNSAMGERSVKSPEFVHF